MAQATNLAVEQEQDLTLEITRIFKASRDRVFSAWSTPAHLQSWWGPKGYSLPEHAFDVVEGGEWRVVMGAPSGTSHMVSGVFKEISPTDRLVFTWGWTIDGERSHESTVTVTFEDVKAGTKVHLHQALLTSKEDRDGHKTGWSGTYDNLQDFLDGKPRDIRTDDKPS